MIAHGDGTLTIVNIKLIHLLDKEVLTHKCSLGEGLIIQNEMVAWVDINKKQIFVHNDNQINIYKTRSTPSVIFKINTNKILFGSDEGLMSLSRLNGIEDIILASKTVIDSSYRSNDGCYFQNFKFLSFMHKSDPINNSGYVYRISNAGWNLIDDSIHIPNSFIRIDNNKLLISDSLSSEIWLFEFNHNGDIISKKIWTVIDRDISPDGGCLVGKKVFISLWDASSIAVFNFDGELEQNIELDVPRPTNCKFDKSKSQLWVTSAREGLSSHQLSKYPLSGDVFKISMSGVC